MLTQETKHVTGSLNKSLASVSAAEKTKALFHRESLDIWLNREQDVEKAPKQRTRGTQQNLATHSAASELYI